MSEEKNPIIDIGDETIDIRKVVRVGSVVGDRDWLRYAVYFSDQNVMEVYENRRRADNAILTQMKRDDFVQLWRSFYTV